MLPVSKLFAMTEQQNSLSAYTLKGIEFLEKIGQFSKERAVIEEEYGSKIRSLVRKYNKKTEDDEILKSSTFVKSFNGFLLNVDIVGTQHQEFSERLKTDVCTYTAAKTVQHRSSRKNTMADFATINENLQSVIGEMFKTKNNYIRSFRDAESAYLKYTKADKNLELSRLELEKIKNRSITKKELCEEAKQSHSAAVDKANNGQDNYYNKHLPMVFERLKDIDKECINDIRYVMRKSLSNENKSEKVIASSFKSTDDCISHVDPELDSHTLMSSIESTIEKAASFEFTDYGDPNDTENRISDVEDVRRPETIFNPMVRKKSENGGMEKSPMKQRKTLRQLFGMREKQENKHSSEDDEDFSDYPPMIRLRCINAKISKMELLLEKAMQGREGLNKLQSAYRENPQLGNASDCNEQLIQHAKEIEKISLKIEEMKALYSDVESSMTDAGETFERSFGGRDTTTDTTHSISGCSTNLSSKGNTLEDTPGSNSEVSKDAEDGAFIRSVTRSPMTGLQMLKSHILSSSPSFAQISPKRFYTSPSPSQTPRRQTNSLLRQKDISSPLSKMSIARKNSAPDVVAALNRTPSALSRSGSKRIKKTAIALYGFETNGEGTITIGEGDVLELLEKDVGDGWSDVKKVETGERGFVPTSYLQFPSTNS